MKIEEFFGSKENVESFLKAKTEKEARELLESKCGKISDEEFKECQAGLAKAVDDAELAEAAGGININREAIKAALKSPTAKKVALAVGFLGTNFLSYKFGKRRKKRLWMILLI